MGTKFFRQVMVGFGSPVASHSKVTALPTFVVVAIAELEFAFAIEGGTVKEKSHQM